MSEATYIDTSLTRADTTTRRLIYLYIFLLFFEGGLRKWILPQLSGPLTIVRDPVMVGIIFSYLTSGRKLLNAYTLPIVALGLFSFVLTLGLGHQNIIIDLFGLRTLVLHFFLIFIAGNVLTRTDVETIGRYAIYLLPLMTLIIGLQFYSPQSAFVNRGVGGDLEGAGFSGTMGYLRPSGTFSFTNGSVTYFSFAAAYLFYFLGESNRIGKIALIVGFVSAVVAIPLSISRTYIVQFAASGLFFFLLSLRSGKSIRNLAIAFLLAPIALVALSTLEFFQTALSVLTNRFEVANRAEGGLDSSISDRFLGGLIRAFTESEDIPWHGMGLGIGTNVGSTVLTGRKVFLVGEGEWSRIVGEMGIWLGGSVLILRLVLSVHLLISGCLAALRGNALPFMLLSFGFLKVLLGGWSQPTSHGFSMLAAGLIIASFNKD